MKKIAILSKNCALAWTGNAFTAGMVLDELFAKFRNTEVTRSAIEGYLTRREPTTQLFSVQLMIWVVGEDQELLQWISHYPIECYEYQPMVLGTGSEPFEETHRRVDGIARPLAGPEGLIGSAFLYYTKLMELEIERPDPTFGMAYEIMGYLDGQFAYLAKVLFCNIVAECNGAQQIKTTNISFCGSFVYSWDEEPNVTCLTWIDPNKSDSDIMLVNLPGNRQWIAETKDRWGARVHENSAEIMRTLLDNVVVYCVRVSFRVGDRLFGPIYSLYDSLSFDRVDYDNTVFVRIKIGGSQDEPDINVCVDYGRNVQQRLMNMA